MFRTIMSKGVIMMAKDRIMEDEMYSGPKREPDVIRRTRILYVKDYLEKYTDEERSASMYDIIKYLDEHGIPAERKSVRDDIIALGENGYGMEIALENGKQWKLLSRDFDLVEIKLIVDCIASSKFLSEAKSKELIKKVETLVSPRQRRSLNRQLIVSGRIKSMNETVLYALDTIHEALLHATDIEFKYYQYNMEKKREFKHNGKVYHVDPQDLLYDNNTYYLLAREGKELKTFRVDRMANVKQCQTTYDDELELDFNFNYNDIDYYSAESYIKSTFGMYHGTEEEVQMLFTKDMMDTVIDKFGKDVKTEIVDSDHFRVTATVSVSPQFYGWIFGLGDNVMIEYPLPVAKQMMDLLKERHKAYRESHSGAIYSANFKKKNRG